MHNIFPNIYQQTKTKSHKIHITNHYTNTPATHKMATTIIEKPFNTLDRNAILYRNQNIITYLVIIPITTAKYTTVNIMQNYAKFM